MSDNRPSVYLENGVAIYRASALGQCVSALVATRLGMTPLPFSDKTELMFDEGNLHEQAVIAKLKAEGWELEDDLAQMEINVPVGSLAVIRGHIDAETPERVVEIKSMSKDVYARWMSRKLDAFPKYAAQLALYMEARNKPGVLVAKNRNNGEMDILYVDELPADVGELKAKVVKAEAMARAGSVPDCALNEWGCRFMYLHEQKEEAIVEDELIEALAETYSKARDAEQIAKQAKDIARGRLLHALGDREKCRTAAWSVTRSVTKRTSIDMERLKNVVNVAEFEVIKESEMLRVTSTLKENQ